MEAFATSSSCCFAVLFLFSSFLTALSPHWVCGHYQSFSNAEVYNVSEHFPLDLPPLCPSLFPEGASVSIWAYIPLDLAEAET